ncbi:MAG: GGDEF domain-containing protein [Alphaproteobacteria bacterium]|nr:GGDEF domain-containing protein [Alphaproteobacteria bacterium]
MSSDVLLEKSNNIARDVLERLVKEHLPPTPENYELWYVYYIQSNAEVVQALKVLEKGKGPISQEDCREIYQRYLSQSRENEAVRNAGEKIQKTIQGMSGTVNSMQSATSRYNITLEGMKERIAKGDIAPEDMENILGSIMLGTQDMMNHNQKLEKELSRSSMAMDELRRDLEIVRREAYTDGLTGLGNRKAFDAEIERIIKETEESGQAFTLVMMDIDHFKSFNDNFGHQVGDQVLRLVARTLTDGIKGRDFAARYGGEEFAVLLPETNLNGGMKVGDILRLAVANKDLVNRASGEKLGRITLSGGVAEHIPGETIESLISRADAALYAAKHNGRNQIASAPTPAQMQADNGIGKKKNKK